MHSLRDPNARWRRTVIPGVALDAVPAEPDARSPGGRLAVAAFLLFVACQTTRWGWWTDIGGHTQDVGYVGQSVDGLAGTLASGVLALVIRARSGARSGFRLIQLLPIVLGLASMLFAVSGFQQVYGEMSSHRASGRPADLDVGAWLALTAGTLAFVGGLRATRDRLRNPVHRDAPAVSLRSFGREVAIGAIGAPVWLLAWLSAGQIGGMWLGMFGVLFSPLVSIGVWRWLSGGGQSDEERRAAGAPVEMDRLREQGRNR